MITKERKEQVWADNAPLLELIYRVEKIMLKDHIYKLVEGLYGATKKDIDKCLKDCLEVGFLKPKQIGLTNKYMYMLTKYPIAKIEGKDNTRKVATIVPSIERIKLSLIKTEYLMSNINEYNKMTDSIWNTNKTETYKLFNYLKNTLNEFELEFDEDYRLEELKHKKLKKIATEEEIEELKKINELKKEKVKKLKCDKKLVQMNEDKPIPNLESIIQEYSLSNFLSSGFRINSVNIEKEKMIINIDYLNIFSLNTGNVYKNIALFYRKLKDYFLKDIYMNISFIGEANSCSSFLKESREKKKNFYTGTLCKNSYYLNRLLNYGVTATDINTNHLNVKTVKIDLEQYNLSLDTF